MKLLKLFLLLAISILTLSLAGCNEETITSVDPPSLKLQKIILPAGATVCSAKLFLNVRSDEYNAHTVAVYNVNAPWTELGVTWNSFHPGEVGSYDASQNYGTYAVTTPGPVSVDVTNLVKGWINGSIENLGLVLTELNPTYTYPPGTRTRYDSNDGAPKPYLEVFYTLTGNCADVLLTPITSEPLADTYIWQTWPNLNYGNEIILYTGNTGPTQQKKSLLKFDFEFTPPEVSCETAYAYDELKGSCFNTLGFSNWGWSIGPLAPPLAPSTTTTYTFPVYAGAGQCDITKGTLVGNVTVNYNGSQAVVIYNIDPAFTVEETHLYVGNVQLPKDKKGKNTVAPGQYPYRGLSNNIEITGNIYVIAHAVVCSDNWD